MCFSKFSIVFNKFLFDINLKYLLCTFQFLNVAFINFYVEVINLYVAVIYVPIVSDDAFSTGKFELVVIMLEGINKSGGFSVFTIFGSVFSVA